MSTTHNTPVEHHIKPNLNHRTSKGFKKAMRVVKGADHLINRPAGCTVEDVASIALTVPARDVIRNKRDDVDLTPLVRALQERGAWQALMGQFSHSTWWEQARRLNDVDVYAASAAAAAAVFKTPKHVPSEKVISRLNEVSNATSEVELLEGALAALAYRERNGLQMAAVAAEGSARRLMEMYVEAVNFHLSKMGGGDRVEASAATLALRDKTDREMEEALRQLREFKEATR